MTSVNVTTTKNTVTVNGETRVVTVKTAGPQGPAFANGTYGDIVVSNDGADLNIATGVIVNADISGDAAIQGLKITPSFGSQNVTTNGNFSCGGGQFTFNNNAGGTIRFLDTNNNPDYYVFSSQGLFQIGQSLDDPIFKINTDKHIDLNDGVDISGGLDVTGIITGTSHIDLPDNAELKLGNNDELTIFYNQPNGNSIIRETGNGILSLQTNGSQISFWDSTNSRLMAEFNTGGSCTFRHGATTRLSTTSTGIDVTGNITSTAGLDVSGGDITGVLGSAVTGTTQSASDNSTKIATTSYVDTAVSNLVNEAPNTLDTLNELAAALGDNPNFATTVTNSIGDKLPLAGGTLTGNLTINTTAPLITFNESDTSKIFNLVLDGSALSIRKDSNAGSNIVQKWNSDGHVDFLTNVDFASGIDVTGDLSVDTDTLFVDSADNRVGIGTTDPQADLHIKSTGDCILILEGDSGNFQGSEHRNPFIKFLQDGSIENSVIGMNPFEVGGENNSLVLANSTGSNGGIVFRTGETSPYTNAVVRMEIKSNGTVDITNNLDVGGGIDVTGAITATVSAANTDILTLTANMGTNNSRFLKFSSPDTDSITEPFNINSNNAIEFEIDNIRTLFIDDDGQVNLHHDGSSTAKLSTTATGVDVNGGINVSTSNQAGLSIVDTSNSNHAPWIEVIGKRSGDNNSQAFSGKIHLAINKTDAKVNSGKNLGAVAFGGNHTDGTLANILYPASIGAESSGDFDAADDMPTDLVFKTGSTGRSPNVPNVSMGIERLRIKANGDVAVDTDTLFVDSTNDKVGINNESPSQALDVTGQIRSFSSTGGNSSSGFRVATANEAFHMYFGSGNADSDFNFTYSASGGNDITVTHDGIVKLFNAGATTPKLATTANGVDIAGNVVATGALQNSIPSDLWNTNNTFVEVGDLGHISTHGAFEFTITSGGYRRNVDGVGKWKDVAVDGVGGFGCQIALAPKTGKIHFRSNSGLSTDDNNPDGAGLTDRLVVSTTGVDVTGNITLPDNGQLQLGGATGGDLKIYHDSLDSYIQETGTGNLFIDASYFTLRNGGGTNIIATFSNGSGSSGGCRLFFTGSTTPKLSTTATGVEVDGKATMTESNASTSNDLRKITTSTSQPSGGNDGDIWIVVPS